MITRVSLDQVIGRSEVGGTLGYGLLAAVGLARTCLHGSPGGVRSCRGVEYRNVLRAIAGERASRARSAPAGV